MKKLVLIFAMIIVAQCLNTENVNGQVLMNLPWEQITNPNRSAMPYQTVRESDVMWAKIVLRRIELSEKANQHLYFTTTPMDNRQSLIDVIMEGIHTQGLTAYFENDNNEFATIATEQQVHEKLGAHTETIENLEGAPKIVQVPYQSDEITSYLLKEIWYYDKQRSVIETKIIGICPIRKYYKDDLDPDHERPFFIKTFWIYYPEARKIFANVDCFNSKNDAARLTFDDVFEKRLFSGYIFAESNLYNNRQVNEYCIGQEALLEGERIKTNLHNYEQDLYEY